MIQSSQYMEPIQIAHRGDSNLYKDNTKESFLSAVKNNFDMIELDIQLTKDNKIIIYHDIYLNKTLIKDLTYEKIYNIDNTLLLFEDLFTIIDISKIKIYIDIKGSIDIIPYLHTILQKQTVDNIYIGCFNMLLLNELHKRNNNYKLGLITSNLFKEQDLLMFIKRYHLTFFCYCWEELNNNIINFLHNHNILVYTYTCTDNKIYSLIKKFNVDGIVTNYKLL